MTDRKAGHLIRHLLRPDMLRSPLPRVLLLGLFVTAIHTLSALPARASLTVTAKWPAGDGVCIDTPLRLTFSGPVHLGTDGKILIFHASDHGMADTLDLAAGSFTDIVGGN